MGTIADKLSYLDTTREKILIETNRLGAGLTEYDKFRDYAEGLYNGYINIINNGIDILYENMKKTTGTGSTITLSDTAMALMKSEIEGNTTQTGTPAPDSPKAINVVSGRQEITITNGTDTQSYEINLGKNLIPTKTFTSTSTTRIVSETTSGQTVYGISVVSGKTYTASFDILTLPSGSDYRIQFINSPNATETQGATDPSRIDREQINCNSLQRYSVSITPTENGYLYLRCVPVGFVLGNIQIEKGSATSYSDYKTPIELCKIGDYQDRIYKDSGKWYIEKKIDKIESYNGETISTDYISTTGQLTTGATVYYVLQAPTIIQITDTELINQLEYFSKAYSYEEQTNITVNGDLPAILNVKALKKYSS